MAVISPGHSGTCSLRSVWHRALPLCTAGAFWEVVHGLSPVDRRCFRCRRNRLPSTFPSGKSVFSSRGPANLGGGASESLTLVLRESKRNRGRLQSLCSSLLNLQFREVPVAPTWGLVVRFKGLPGLQLASFNYSQFCHFLGYNFVLVTYSVLASLSALLTWCHSVQSLGRYSALCNPVDRSMPGFPVHHQLPEPAQTRVLYPAWHCMMYSAYKLNNQGDSIYSLDYSFPNFEPVCCSMSSSNHCLLTCIQILQEAKGDLLFLSL